jgi:hypothetical protein
MDMLKVTFLVSAEVWKRQVSGAKSAPFLGWGVCFTLWCYSKEQLQVTGDYRGALQISHSVFLQLLHGCHLSNYCRLVSCDIFIFLAGTGSTSWRIASWTSCKYLAMLGWPRPFTFLECRVCVGGGLVVLGCCYYMGSWTSWLSE